MTGWIEEGAVFEHGAGDGEEAVANKPANRATRLGSAQLEAGSRRDRLYASTAIGAPHLSAGHGVPWQFSDDPAGVGRPDQVAP